MKEELKSIERMSISSVSAIDVMVKHITDAILKIKTEEPERESDEFDAGQKAMQEKIISLLNS